MNYDIISNDSELLEIYDLIDKVEDKETHYAYHGLNHILSVVKTIEKVLNALECDEEYIENAKIAAFMHDLGMIKGKDNHEILGSIMARDYLKRKNIKLKYEEEVIEAIKLHRGYDKMNSLIALALIFSDKIDIKRSRVTDVGKTIQGMRQYWYIKDIEFSLNNNEFIINFDIEDECNKKELEEYYFTKKVFKAINNFCDNINKKAIITWNNKDWKLK